MQPLRSQSLYTPPHDREELRRGYWGSRGKGKERASQGFPRRFFVNKRKRRGVSDSTRLGTDHVRASHRAVRVVYAYLPEERLPQLSMLYGCDSPRATLFLRSITRDAGPRVGHH